MLEPDERIVVIGPTPPPIHGVAFTTPHVIEAVAAVDKLAAHLDTSDPRPVVTTGRFDLRNAWLGIRHGIQLAWLLARNRGAAVYLPLSQVTWGFIRDAVFIWITKLFRRRMIVHLNGGLFRTFARESGPVMRRLIAMTTRLVDEAWVLTPAHIDMFEGLIPASQVAILQNTAEDQGALIGARANDRSGDPTRRFLYLSNLLPEKGCFDLLNAFELLGEVARGIELRYAGEADAGVLQELERRSRGLAANGVTVSYDGTLTGRAKTRAFEWAQVFVLPSRYPLEGQPLSLIEAMSAGVPVISTEHSGIPHTTRDDKEALLVRPGDVGALAGAIQRLIEDPELRERLGASGRRRYAEVYRPDLFERAVAELLIGSISGSADDACVTAGQVGVTAGTGKGT